MTATRTPGLPFVDDGRLVSTNPATGEEVGRFPVAEPADVAAAVERARAAATWWAGLGFGARRERLLRFRSSLANRITELAALMHDETGKPEAEAIVECAGAIDHVAWAAKHGRKVMAACAESLTPVLLECGGKDALIVDADADLDKAVSACVWGAMTNAGQTCVGLERVYVVDAVYEPFLAKLVTRAGELKAGV